MSGTSEEVSSQIDELRSDDAELSDGKNQCDELIVKNLETQGPAQSLGKNI